MAKAKNVLMKCLAEKVGGTGSVDCYFRSNKDLYTGTFATATGISEAPAAEKSNPPLALHQLKKAGWLYACYVMLAGTATDPVRSVSVLVCNKNLVSFLAWCAAGTNTLPGYGKVVIGGGLRQNRMSLS